nr:hypothetical protein TDPV-225 [Oriental turtle dovepox virus]
MSAPLDTSVFISTSSGNITALCKGVSLKHENIIMKLIHNYVMYIRAYYCIDIQTYSNN